MRRVEYCDGKFVSFSKKKMILCYNLFENFLENNSCLDMLVHLLSVVACISFRFRRFNQVRLGLCDARWLPAIVNITRYEFSH